MGGTGAVGASPSAGAVLADAVLAAAAATLRPSTGESLLLLNFGLSSPPCEVTGGL